MASVNKSAKTGQFVSNKQVQQSPSTTYKQSTCSTKSSGGNKGKSK